MGAMHPLIPPWATTGLLLAGLGLLGLGWALKRRQGHLVILAGWVAIGAYWPTQTPHFLAVDDTVNALFTLLALPFFLYLAYHEWLSYVRDEDPRGLRWMTGTAFTASVLYFVFHVWEPMAKFMINMVAGQTLWLLNLSHGGYTAGAFTASSAPTLAPGYVPIHLTNNSVFLPGVISIVLACTAMQAIAIFAGAIAVAPASRRRKAKALLATVPIIYGLNLIRNWGIIYGVDVWAMDFAFMHNWIGKGGSLLALIGLAVLTFELLPEVHDSILEIMDLHKRRGPLEDGVRRLLGADPEPRTR